MSNFYDLETDLDTESEEEFETLQSNSIETEEEYEEITEFGTYDETAAENKWGNMEFDKLIIEMEALVSRGKKFFFSKKKRIVEAEEIATLSQYIQNKFPQEMIDAKAVLDNEAAIVDQATKEANEIIANARKQEAEIVANARSFYASTTDKGKKDAEAILKRAKAQADEMVKEHSITRMAREQSEQIKTNTEVHVKSMLAEADAQCTELKNQSKEWAIGIVQGAHDFVLNSLAGYQKVAATSLDQISEVNRSFQAEYNQQTAKLGLNNTNNNQ